MSGAYIPPHLRRAKEQEELQQLQQQQELNQSSLASTQPPTTTTTTTTTTTLISTNPGTYLPPSVRRRLAEEGQLQPTTIPNDNEDDKIDPTQLQQRLQRSSWDVLVKTIKSINNKINRQNFATICSEELFQPNLIRGRGIFAKDLLERALDSLPVIGTHDIRPIYAALVAVVNSQLPNIGQMVAARVLERYEKRIRINVDKMTAKPALDFICWLANFYVIDFITILQIIRILLPAPIDKFVSLLADPLTASTPIVVAQTQMCELSIHVFTMCAQLLKSEELTIYQSLIEAFRSLLQELEATIGSAIQMNEPQFHEQNNNTKKYNKNNNNNKYSQNQQQNTTQNTPPSRHESYTRLKFALEHLLEHARTNFIQFPQFADEQPELDENGQPINPNYDPTLYSLNLIHTDDQYTHSFDLSDPKSIQLLCDEKSNWFKIDPQYDENELQWEHHRDVILGLVDDDDDNDNNNEQSNINIDINDVTENSPFLAILQARKLKQQQHESKQRLLQGDNTEIDYDNRIKGFGGEVDLSKAYVDPKVEEVQIRKTVYLTIQQSVSADEVAHRLLQMLSKRSDKARFIKCVALTIYDTMLARGVYEQNDGTVGIKLCQKMRQFALEFEDLFAITCSDIVNKKENESRILATFFGDLLSYEAIDYNIFQYILFDVRKESLQDPVALSTRVFLTALLSHLRKTITERKLFNILTFHTFYPYTKQLFTFDDVKQYISASKFYEIANLTLFKQRVEENQRIFIERSGYDEKNIKGSDNDTSDISDSDTYSSDSSSSSSSSSSSESEYERKYQPQSSSRHRNYSPSTSSSSSSSRSRSRQSTYRRSRSTSSSSDSDRYHYKNKRRDSSSPQRQRHSHRPIQSDSDSDDEYHRRQYRNHSPSNYSRQSRSKTRSNSPPPQHSPPQKRENYHRSYSRSSSRSHSPPSTYHQREQQRERSYSNVHNENNNNNIRNNSPPPPPPFPKQDQLQPPLPPPFPHTTNNDINNLQPPPMPPPFPHRQNQDQSIVSPPPPPPMKDFNTNSNNNSNNNNNDYRNNDNNNNDYRNNSNNNNDHRNNNNNNDFRNANNNNNNNNNDYRNNNNNNNNDYRNNNNNNNDYRNNNNNNQNQNRNYDNNNDYRNNNNNPNYRGNNNNNNNYQSNNRNNNNNDYQNTNRNTDNNNDYRNNNNNNNNNDYRNNNNMNRNNHNNNNDYRNNNNNNKNNRYTPNKNQQQYNNNNNRNFYSNNNNNYFQDDSLPPPLETHNNNNNRKIRPRPNDNYGQSDDETHTNNNNTGANYQSRQRLNQSTDNTTISQPQPQQQVEDEERF